MVQTREALLHEPTWLPQRETANGDGPTTIPSVLEEARESTTTALWTESSESTSTVSWPPSGRYKRAFDLVFGSLVLLVAAPIIPIIALAVKLSSPGPVFFHQERIGRHGRPFRLTKFRSMYANVDSKQHREYFKQYLRGVPAPNEKGNLFKMRNDPRITPVGRVLRRLGLDELPQLVQVLAGDMSLVGPRPPLAYEVAHYTQRHMERLLVKPGITGMWQVRGRDVVNFESMVDMDLDYVEKMSFWLDLKLMLLTGPSLAWAVLTK